MKEGKKNDKLDGKLRWELLPLPLIEEIVKVYTFGATKYDDNSWQTLPNGENRYKAAMLRHLVAYDKGEVNDPESGINHLAHVAWNAIAMLHLSLKEHTKNKEPEPNKDNVSLCCPSCHSCDGIYVRNAETGLVQCRKCLTAFYVNSEDGEQENNETKETSK